MMKIKRVYEAPSNEDGFRILVDRLWPRGLSKEKAKVDLCLKEIAPSEGLRKWFAHETGKWDEFCKRYWIEIEQKKDLITLIERKKKEETVTFVYAAHDEKNNIALALKMFIDSPA
jgi:uncharacterized protein YeaO (DUF488 family)